MTPGSSCSVLEVLRQSSVEVRELLGVEDATNPLVVGVVPAVLDQFPKFAGQFSLLPSGLPQRGYRLGVRLAHLHRDLSESFGTLPTMYTFSSESTTVSWTSRVSRQKSAPGST